MILKSSLSIVFATLLISVVILAATSAFGVKCIKCYAKWGNGGDGVDGGWAKAGDVGTGGSCVAEIIGNECGGSTSSNEPRGGEAGDGGNGGDAVIFGSKNPINRNTTDIVNTTETG